MRSGGCNGGYVPLFCKPIVFALQNNSPCPLKPMVLGGKTIGFVTY